MQGVVACEALYNLIERLAPAATIRYIPAELHEFPINVPLESDIHDRVQDAVSELVEAGCEPIVVSYAMDQETRTSLRSMDAEVVVSDEADCISTVLPQDYAQSGEKKAPRSLYLTRGWIDCGVDGYKLYRAYRDDLDDLLESFEEAAARHDDLRVSWHTGDRFNRAHTEQRGVSRELIDGFFYEIVKYYDRVVLVDTGDLYEFHHSYAEAVRAFISGLRQDQGDGEPITLTTIEAELSGIRSLLEDTSGD